MYHVLEVGRSNIIKVAQDDMFVQIFIFKTFFESEFLNDVIANGFVEMQKRRHVNNC
jgi:hypothetical protein